MAGVNLQVLKKLNSAFEENVPDEKVYNDAEEVIRNFLAYSPERVYNGDYTSNVYSFFSNYLRYAIEKRRLNPNNILMFLVKHTYNYIGLYLIGMVIRSGANPNVSVNTKDYGKIHILAALATRVDGPDPYFNNVCALLRLLGSDYNYPVYRFSESGQDALDFTFVESIGGNSDRRSSVLTKDFMIQFGKNPEFDINTYMTSLTLPEATQLIIASDDYDKLEKNLSNDYMEFIKSTRQNTVGMLVDLSTAYCTNIPKNITEKEFPLITESFNGQVLPLYAASTSLNKKMFNYFVNKGSQVKYLTMNCLTVYYKIYSKEEIRLYENAYNMILDAINVGAYMDRYQFMEINVGGNYDQINQIQVAYSDPQWEKVCRIKSDKPRQEIKEIAFNLNLDYDLSEEKLCKKLKQMSMRSKDDLFSAAIRRQEDRVEAYTSSTTDYLNTDNPPKNRCSLRSTVLKNPYAYNDARMAFYKSPKDGEVYCFTSDTFNDLLSSKINPYNGENLPVKFLSTIKTQINLLNELGVIKTNITVKDALKEVFEKSTINNDKTDYSYNTVISALELSGVSKERFNNLSIISQRDTILRDICGVNLKHFDKLTTMHRVKTVARVIYSISKKPGNPNPAEIFNEVGRAIGGGDLIEENENQDDVTQLLNQ